MLYIAGSKRKLHFVTVHAPDTQPSTDAKDRRNVREFVMRDYLRQKNKPEWKLAPPTVPEPIDAHMSRFRSSVPQARVKTSKRTRKPRFVPKHLPKRKERQLIPAPVHTENHAQQDERKSDASIHDLDMLDAFQVFSIDLSDSETMGLLQYYYTSFWTNSYAINPQGSWINVALTDSATMHATLNLVAIHRRDRFSIDLSKVYFQHRGKAMKIIASRLNDPKDSLNDATIGAVAILATSDNEFDWSRETQMSHSKGLSRLIALRGGIEALSTNEHVQRVVAWADLLQSAIHGTGLQAKIPSSVRLPSSNEPETSISWPGMSETASDSLLEGLPPKTREIIQELRVLASLKAVLLVDRTQKLCKIFSDMLWKLEHEVLELRQNPMVRQNHDRFNGLLGEEAMVTAVGTGALIFSYSILRDLASPILFRRLRINLVECFLAAQRGSQSTGSERQPLGSTFWKNRDENEAALLLWLLYLGWKAVPGEDEWFAKEAAQLCVSNRILSQNSVLERVQSVVPQAQNLALATAEFWRGIEEILWSGTIRPVRPEPYQGLGLP
ncbi:hypothetical protein H2200_007497 [Cladophialophora chaetospira]|uniref:Tachykinin family protein n=1 Tax=Cladophialophora chaetospira TaxID=386627 RepID=A0AA38X837_9EURO|nr:hypothetical protein H2200_007497 [Cladophialophora chaetospira]